jgi:hypothetical protein
MADGWLFTGKCPSCAQDVRGTLVYESERPMLPALTLEVVCPCTQPVTVFEIHTMAEQNTV